MASEIPLLAEVEKTIEGLSSPEIEGAITYHTGGEWLGANDSPPRIVWVPTADDTRPIEPHYPDAEAARTATRTIWEFDSSIDAHLWGKTFSEALALRDLLINALRNAVGAAFKPLRGFWPVQDAQKITQCGRVYVLTIQFPVPVLEFPGGVATVKSVDEDVGLEERAS